MEQSGSTDSTESTADPIKIVGWKLDLVRRAAGLSQAQLAERAEVSPAHISRVINGKVGVSQDVMTRILAVFGDQITFAELTTDGPRT